MERFELQYSKKEKYKVGLVCSIIVFAVIIAVMLAAGPSNGWILAAICAGGVSVFFTIKLIRHGKEKQVILVMNEHGIVLGQEPAFGPAWYGWSEIERVEAVRGFFAGRAYIPPRLLLYLKPSPEKPNKDRFGAIYLEYSPVSEEVVARKARSFLKEYGGDNATDPVE